MAKSSSVWGRSRTKAHFNIDDEEYNILTAAVKSSMDRDKLLGETFVNHTTRNFLADCLRSNYDNFPAFVHNAGGGGDPDEQLGALTGVAHWINLSYRQSQMRRQKRLAARAGIPLQDQTPQAQAQAQPPRPFELRTILVRNIVDCRYDGRCTVKDICHWPLPSTSAAANHSTHPPPSLTVDDFDYEKWTTFLREECGYDSGQHVLSVVI